MMHLRYREVPLGRLRAAVHSPPWHVCWVAVSAPWVRRARSGPAAAPLVVARRQLPMDTYKVFVSYGSHDLWLASQIAKEIRGLGALPLTSMPT